MPKYFHLAWMASLRVRLVGISHAGYGGGKLPTR